MILLLGSTGYIGSAFTMELKRRELEFAAISRKDFDYTQYEVANKLLRDLRPEVVINAAAFVPKPSVDACKEHKLETLQGNVLLPTTLMTVCDRHGAILAHISTACLYDDKKVYHEWDPPTRDMTGYCGEYLKSKWLAECVVRSMQRHYIWRIRLPVDEEINDRNYFDKLRTYPKVWRQTNSVTCRKDFVHAAIEMLEKRPEFGTYHMVNPGWLSAPQMAEWFKENGLRGDFEIVEGPCPGSTLSHDKLDANGISMRNIADVAARYLSNAKK